jgi:translation initiation factor IF-2
LFRGITRVRPARRESGDKLWNRRPECARILASVDSKSERGKHEMTEDIFIGHVSHYFGKIQVAAIELTDGELHVGDTIRIAGHTSDFTQKIDSMQIDNANVPQAKKGESIGIRVSEHARVGDKVYKVVD